MTQFQFTVHMGEKFIYWVNFIFGSLKIIELDPASR